MTNWLNDIDEISAQFDRAFGALTIEQLHWKPNANTWSIAQNMDHLRVVNETYYPVLEALKAGTYPRPFMAKLGFMVSFLGATVLKAVEPGREKKMKTFPIWEPTTSPINEHIRREFGQHQAELKQQIEAAKPYLNQGLVIASPANSFVVYKLETAFDIIVSHERRHLAQAQEVLAWIEKHT